MIVRRLVEPLDGGPYLVEEHEVDTAMADDCVGELWRTPGTVGVVVLLPEEQVDALYLDEGLDQGRIPADWVWRGLPPVKPDVAIREPRVVAPIRREPPPPLPPGFQYDTAAWCGCCHTAKEGAYHPDEQDRTPGGRLAEARCMACGGRLEGMTAKDIQQMYFAYLRG